MIEATMLDAPLDQDVPMASSPAYYHADAMMADYDQPQLEEVDMDDDTGDQPEYEMSDAHVYYDEAQLHDAEIVDASRVVSPLPAPTIDPPAPPPQDLHPLTPGHTHALTPLSAAVHTADIDPFSLHSYPAAAPAEVVPHSDSVLAPEHADLTVHLDESQNHSEPELQLEELAEPAESSSVLTNEPVTHAAEPVLLETTHLPHAGEEEAEQDPLAHYDETQVTHEPDYTTLQLANDADVAHAHDSETAAPAPPGVSESYETAPTQAGVPEPYETEEAPAASALATYAEYEEEDDFSDPSDENMSMPPSPVSLTVEGEDNVHYTLFVAPENIAASSGTTFLFTDRQDLYYAPFSAFFKALRELDVFASKSEYEELAIFATQLNLKISEDNKHVQEVSLYDLGLLHESFGVEGSLQIQLQTITPRFFQRLTFLRQEAAKMMADTGSSSHDEEEGAPAQDETAEYEDAPPLLEAAPAALPVGEAEAEVEDDAQAAAVPAGEETYAAEETYEALAEALAEHEPEHEHEPYTAGPEPVQSAEADPPAEAVVEGEFDEDASGDADASAEYSELAEYDDAGEYDGEEGDAQHEHAPHFTEGITDPAPAEQEEEAEDGHEQAPQAVEAEDEQYYQEDTAPVADVTDTAESAEQQKDVTLQQHDTSVPDPSADALQYETAALPNPAAPEAEGDEEYDAPYPHPAPYEEAEHEEAESFPEEGAQAAPEHETTSEQLVDAAAPAVYDDEAYDEDADAEGEGDDYVDDQATLSSADDRPAHPLSSKRSHDELDELDGAGLDEDDHESKRARVQ